MMDESAATSARGKVLPVVGRVVTRNTDAFGSVGAADVLVRVLTQYDFDVNVVQWAARAVNNLSKSRSLKSEFLKAGVIEVLTDLYSKYEGNKDSQLWIKQAVESLQSATTVAHSGPDRTPHTSSTGGMGRTAMSFTTEKISTKIGDLLNMNSSVGSNASSSGSGGGGGGGGVGSSVEKSAAKKRQSPGVNVTS